MNISIPPFVLKLMNTLTENGYECFVVGGAVRSALLDLPVHDYDLTTNALPDEMKRVFRDFHTVETGIRHGTLTVFSDHKPVEITAYRKDSVYSDHRHPDSVEFTSALKEDCARRDFTVNALCADSFGRLYDFFDGQKDLNSQLIRCIGDPDERFNEDALRILRAVRFAARLGFDIDPGTSAALFRNKELLNFISAERIHDEMMGFLDAESCPELFREYYEIFEVFIPGLKELSGSQRELLFRSIEHSVNNALIRFAMIMAHLNDPVNVMKQLKFSNHDIGMVQNLLALKERPASTPADIRRILRDLTLPFEQYADFRYAADETADHDAMIQTYEMIQENHDCYSLKQLAVNGSDLIKAGFRGKEISDALNTLLDEVIEKRLNNEKDALLSYISSVQK